MKFLIDTNIFIPLEPTSLEDLQREDPEVVELARRIQQAGHVLYVHPAIQHDIRRDSDTVRRAVRERLVRKYPILTSPPPVAADLRAQIGDASEGSNDWVDNQHVAALDADAVDYLITNDGALQCKAVRAGLEERILTSAEARELVARLFDTTPPPPPAVESKIA